MKIALAGFSIESSTFIPYFVVVKIGYLEPELEKQAHKALLALSPGGVNQDLQNLPFKELVRPIFPLEEKMKWNPRL